VTEEIDLQTTLLRALSYMAVLVAGQMEPLSKSMLRGLTAGGGAVELLFELADQAEIGEVCGTEDALEWLETLEPDSLVLDFHLEAARTEVVSASDAVAQRLHNMVGAALLPASGEWIFWRPVSYPHGSSRLLLIPAWKPNSY